MKKVDDDYYNYNQEDHKKFLNENYKGNKRAYLRDREEHRREVIQWDNIILSATIFPELEDKAQYLIKTLLGYLPVDYLTLPHEPAIRALLYNRQMGSISTDDLMKQVEEHVKLIRNEDIKSHSCIIYGMSTYRKYESCAPLHLEKVKQRLTKFLGYEPQLDTSISIELYLYEKYLSDRYYFPEEYTDKEMQAMTIIKYREVLLEHGKAAADASPLAAIDIMAQKVLYE